MSVSDNRHFIHSTFLLGFFISAHGYLLIYINSSFLAQFSSPRMVSIIFTLGNLLAVGLLATTPYFVRAAGNYTTMLAVLLGELISVIGLAFSNSFFFIVPLFVAHVSLVRMMLYQMDIFLESHSSNNHTGDIRGAYLTATNVALVIAPLATGIILGTSEQYSRVYAVAALILILPILVLTSRFQTFKDPTYQHFKLREAFRDVRKNRNVLLILKSNLMLRLFYAWMVIYMPIYLHEHIGFSWESIGVMFTIMLLPFVLFELPLGRLADSRWGEKEALTIGYIIMGLVAFSFAFVESANFALWAILLFLSRVGASFVEIMNETYFFKKIDGADAGVMSLFRIVQPAAYVVGPLLASVVLLFLPDFRFLFIALAVLMFWAIRYSSAIKDTL